MRVLLTATFVGGAGSVAAFLLPMAGFVGGTLCLLAGAYYVYRESPVHDYKLAVARRRAARAALRTGYATHRGQLVAGTTPLRAPMSGRTAIVTRHDVIVRGRVVLRSLGWCEAQLRGRDAVLALSGPLELLPTGPPDVVRALASATLLIRDMELNGAAIAGLYRNAKVEERLLGAGPARVHIDSTHATAEGVADAPYREGADSASAREGAPILIEPT